MTDTESLTPDKPAGRLFSLISAARWKSWLLTWLTLAMLAVIAWVPYSNAPTAEFIFDSEAIIRYDPRVQQPASTEPVYSLWTDIRALFYVPWKEAPFARTRELLFHRKPDQSFFGEVFTSHYWHCQSAFYDLFYRPMVTLSYAINYWPSGFAEFPVEDAAKMAHLYRSYHIVNWVLHLLGVFVLYGITRKLLAQYSSGLFANPDAGSDKAYSSQLLGGGQDIIKRRVVPFLVAALFAVHPAHTEAVTNIVGRADVMATLFVLMGLYAHMRSRESGGWIAGVWIVLTTIALLLGIMTKESGIVLIGLAFLYDFILAPARNGSAEPRKRIHIAKWISTYCSFAVVTVSFLVVRWCVLRKYDPSYVDGLNNPLVDHGFVVSKLTAVKLMGKQIFLMLWPFRLSPDYSYDAIPVFSLNIGEVKGFWGVSRLIWEDAQSVVMLVTLIAALVYAFKSVRRRPLVSFLILAFLGAALPTSNLVLEIGSIMAERFLYLPTVWFLMLIVIATMAMLQRLFRQSADREQRKMSEVVGDVIVPPFERQLESRGTGSLLQSNPATLIIAAMTFALAVSWPLWWRFMPQWLNPSLASDLMKNGDWRAALLAAPWSAVLVCVAVFLWPIRWWTGGTQWKAPVIILAVLASSFAQVAAVRTYARNIDWQSTEALWRHAVAVMPHSAKTHVNYANSIFQKKNIDEARLNNAIEHSEDGWSMKRYATFGANLGAFYVLKADRMLEAGVRQGVSPQQMEQLKQQAFELYSRGAQVLWEARADEQRMVRILHEGLQSQAEEIRRGRSGQSFWDALLWRGYKGDKALHESKAHGNPALYQNLGTALVRLNRNYEAAQVFRHALALEPGGIAGRMALAEVLTRMGQHEEAAVVLFEVIVMDDRNIDAGRALNEVYSHLVQEKKQVIGLDPQTRQVRVIISPPPPMIQEHLCAAMLNLMRSYAGIGEKQRAKLIRDAAVTNYRCAPQAFDQALQNPRHPVPAF